MLKLLKWLHIHNNDIIFESHPKQLFPQHYPFDESIEVFAASINKRNIKHNHIPIANIKHQTHTSVQTQRKTDTMR